MKSERTWEFHGYQMRLAKQADADAYYENNFRIMDKEVVRFTGGKSSYEKEEVIQFFMQRLQDPNRYDFLILSPENEIIGESVINEYNEEINSANFRIAIFHNEKCGKGIGSWAIRNTIQYAFEEIHLHRLELDVFSFNTRAYRAYLKAGFKEEGRLREAIKDIDGYADDILMAILDRDYKKLSKGF